jgi:pyruvate formate lyase activating enzyme
MAQAGFVRKVGEMCREAGLHVALDTCGFVPWERYEQVLPLVDLVLYDLKILDAGHHRSATSVDNARILDNARRIASAGMPLWIRTPIIPGYTDGEENIRGLAEFIAAELPTVERWDLLAYTNLGKPKYKRLERCYVLEDAPLLTRAAMESLHAIAAGRVPVAVWSGATRREEEASEGRIRSR